MWESLSSLKEKRLFMKKVVSLLAIVVLIFSLNYAAQETERPLEKVRAKYLIGLNQFQQEVKSFKNALWEYRKGELEAVQLQLSFAKLRNSYKRIEFMLDYLEPQDVKDHINGAPLPKTERNAPRLVILEPKGLQRMEELVYSADLSSDFNQLTELTKTLEYQLKVILGFAKRTPLSDRQIFEAVRMGIIRILSMGITGFDTPASDQAIAESAVAWESLSSALDPYLKGLGESSLRTAIELKLQGGLKQLQSAASFDSFDRLEFIRNFAEPLYGLVLDLHLALHFETSDEVFRGQLPFHYQSRHLFSSGFYNLQYYTGLEHDSAFRAKADLGKLLFFEPALSANFERSCASCHQADKAFGDGLEKSIAFDFKGTVDRNAPGLFNALYSEKFFHDLRADRMEAQMEHVIFSPKEFAANYKTIFRRLKSSETYQNLFNRAFPEFNGAVNRHTLSQAIVAFLSELSSFNSPVDQYLRGERGQLEPKIKEGFNLFMGKAACGTCHFAPSFSGLVPPLFTENESEVLGVLSGPVSKELDADLGRYRNGVAQDEALFYKHSFKTPTVRNVEHTAPYFHNGAYPNLASVLEFYNHGGALGLGLDLPNQTLPGDSLNLSPTELKALEAFLLALSDTSQTPSLPTELPQLEGRPKHLIGGKY